MSKHKVISVKSKTFEMGINYLTPSRRKAADGNFFLVIQTQKHRKAHKSLIYSRSSQFLLEKETVAKKDFQIVPMCFDILGRADNGMNTMFSLRSTIKIELTHYRVPLLLT